MEQEKSVRELNYGSNFEYASSDLVRIGKEFYARGWLYGTSGNLSKVMSSEPIRLAITPSGFDKGNLLESQVLEIDEELNVISGDFKPSSESALHVAVVRGMNAGAVFHTHSIWSTILSRKFVNAGGFEISGYEMLKGLDGVRTHEHIEWIPVLENSQDMAALSTELSMELKKHPSSHAFLLSGHGMYTWGKTIEEAKRHVEALEFLLEVIGRTSGSN